MTRQKFILCLVLFLGFGCRLPLHAQIEAKLYPDSHHLDSLRVKQLRLDIDNLNFFQNNEYNGDYMNGYTLPGLRFAPKLSYMPISNLKLEVGFHALVFNGAYKYPNFAYQDISNWKGVQYQKGSHLTPHFRGQLTLGNLNLIFGNLYGGSEHRLILPLYDPELNLTSDPETGFQLLYNRPRFHLDAWINWQSFIFDLDTHQEAFTVGVSSKLLLNKPESTLHSYLQLQATIQHRGGEIDDTNTGANTLTNGAVGAGLQWNIAGSLFQRFSLEVNALGYLQQSGSLWPYDRGAAGYLQADLAFARYFNLQASYYTGKHFISLFGLPFYGSVSTAEDDAVFNDLTRTLHLGIDYSRTFARHYTLGAKAEVYHATPGRMTLPDGSIKDCSPSLYYSFGVFLRANLSFLLKKW